MRKFLFCFLLITTSVYSADSDVSRNEFLKAYEPILDGNPIEGVRLLKNLANNGNADANVALARIYKNGTILDINQDKACIFALKAAELGSPGGFFHHALCEYLEYVGKGEQVDANHLDEIAKKMQIAIDANYEEILSTDLSSMFSVLKIPSASKLLSIALDYSESDDPRKLYSSSIYLFKGLGTYSDDQQINQAKMALKKSADMGFPPAQLELAKFAMTPVGDGYNIKYDLREFVNSIKHGVLGNIYFLPLISTLQGSDSKNLFLTQDDLSLISKGLEIVESWNQMMLSFSMGVLYMQGSELLQLEKDYTKAIYHLEECASHWDGEELNSVVSNCLSFLGDIYFDTADVNATLTQERLIQSFESYKRAVKAYQNNLASSNLARAYQNGWGTEIDYEKAYEYYKLATDWGNVHAYFPLGELYERGLGIRFDYNLAAQYYRKSIDSNARLIDSYAHLADLTARELIPGTLNDSAKLYREALALEPNSWELEIVAKSQTRLAQIEKLILERVPEARAVTYGKYHALLIGINDYEHLKDLKTPLNDIQRLGDVLDKDFGFDVQILENASRDMILRELAGYRKKMDEQDNLLIYYAGHGYLDEETGVGFWQPSDSESDIDSAWIPTDRITRTLKGIKSNNIAVISDSCFAGTMLRGDDQNRVNVNDSIAVQRLVEKKTRVALASGGLEPVPDNLSNGKNSIFASQLVFALKESNQVTTATDLFLSIQKRVIGTTARLGFEQSPEFSALYESGHEGGDFVFVKK